MNRTGVCQAYAYGYMYIMEKLGIECYVTSSNAMGHAWNIIEIDGSYYHVDVTWDDPVRDRFGQVGHSNFLLSDAAIKETEHHDWIDQIWYAIVPNMTMHIGLRWIRRLFYRMRMLTI